MKLKSFLTLNSVMFIPFGIGMLIIPSLIFPLIGVNLDMDGSLMASTVGSMLLSFGIVCFLGRNENVNTIGMKAILAGNLSFHAIDFILTGQGAITAVMNPIGYMFSSLHFLFALGFLYFLIKSRN